MNAGAHGGETWERVASVRTIDRKGQVHERAPLEYSVGYRSVTGPGNEWFIEGTFRFTGNDDDIPFTGEYLDFAGMSRDELQAKLFASHDGKEGIAAYVEKRQANFEGK